MIHLARRAHRQILDHRDPRNQRRRTGGVEHGRDAVFTGHDPPYTGHDPPYTGEGVPC